MTKFIITGLMLCTAAHADWISGPNGKAYHPQRTCIALKRTKEPIEISAADAAKRGLKLCGICSRWKKAK